MMAWGRTSHRELGLLHSFRSDTGRFGQSRLSKNLAGIGAATILSLVGIAVLPAAVAAATPATVPGAPIIGNANATGISGQAVVNFTAPASNGGSAIIAYTATAADSTNPANGGQTASSSSSPIKIGGLTNGDLYTFTVVARNSVGNSPSSAPSNAVLPATIPGAPTIGTATAGNGQANVAFTPPSTNGGRTITDYVVKPTNISVPYDGAVAGVGTSSPITVTGLINGDSYTFTVAAINGNGQGPLSQASNVVTPSATAELKYWPPDQQRGRDGFHTEWNGILDRRLIRSGLASRRRGQLRLDGRPTPQLPNCPHRLYPGRQGLLAGGW